MRLVLLVLPVVPVLHVRLVLLVRPVLPGGLLPVLPVLLVRPVLPVQPVHLVLPAACARLSSRLCRDTFDRPQTLQPVNVFEALDLKPCGLCTFLNSRPQFLVFSRVFVGFKQLGLVLPVRPLQPVHAFKLPTT